MLSKKKKFVLIRVDSWLCPRDKGTILILVVGLLSMLAIIGTVFLLTARVDRQAAANQGVSTQYDLIFEMVQARVEEELMADLFDGGNDLLSDVDTDDISTGTKANEPWDCAYTNSNAGQEGKMDDAWLAAAEPVSGNWPHITNLELKASTEVINVSTGANELADSTRLADADGDGINDSYWIDSGITAADGTRFRYAVRIVDNAARVNLNTAWDTPSDAINQGIVLTQINLDQVRASGDDNGELNTASGHSGYSGRFGTVSPVYGTDDAGLGNYHNDVVMKYEDPATGITLFDASDELAIALGGIIGNDHSAVRLVKCWSDTLDGDDDFDDSTKHLITTQSWSRHIRPQEITAWDFNTDSKEDITPYDQTPGRYRPFDINRQFGSSVTLTASPLTTAEKQAANRRLKELLERAFTDAKTAIPFSATNAIQYVMNLYDYIDTDIEPCLMVDVFGTGHGYTVTCYGNEQQLYFSSVYVDWGGAPNYAIDQQAFELWNPGDQDIVVSNNWKITGLKNGDLMLPNGTIPAKSWVLLTKLGTSGGTYQEINGLSNLVFKDTPGEIGLERKMADGVWVTVDQINSTETNSFSTSGSPQLNSKYKERAGGPGMWGAGFNVWSPEGQANTHRAANGYSPATAGIDGPFRLLTLDDDKRLYYIGQISEVLCVGHTCDKDGNVKCLPEQFADSKASEKDLRLDWSDSAHQKILDYITILDRAHNAKDNADTAHDENGDGTPDDTGEMRIAGQININTAPNKVLMALNTDNLITSSVADNIISARTTSPFRTIGGLRAITGIESTSDSDDLTTDNITGDLEQKDALFNRIGQLATVRSDCFTVYVVVEAIDSEFTGNITDSTENADDYILSSKHMVLVLDRSRCFTGNTSSLDYRTPTTVAKLIVDK